MKKVSLKNKRVLITAGPTWVAIDDVRVISNISTGGLGLLLAQEAKLRGLRTDLFLGPVGHLKLGKGIRVFRFSYFYELLKLVESRLKTTRYDIILHCAAVSDYLAKEKYGKISSQEHGLVLHLKRSPKIIKRMRRLNPQALLVLFKLESKVSDSVLLKRAAQAKKESRADLAVANILTHKKYKGYILNGRGVLSKADSKKQLARQLFKVLERWCVNEIYCSCAGRDGG